MEGSFLLSSLCFCSVCHCSLCCCIVRKTKEFKKVNCESHRGRTAISLIEEKEPKFIDYCLNCVFGIDFQRKSGFITFSSGFLRPFQPKFSCFV